MIMFIENTENGFSLKKTCYLCLKTKENQTTRIYAEQSTLVVTLLKINFLREFAGSKMGRI